MKKPSKSLVFKATCAILVILLLGQISLFYVCQCVEKEIPFTNSRRSENNRENFKESSEKVLHLERQITKLKEQLRSQSNIIQKIGKQNQNLRLLVEAYKRSANSKFTQGRSDDYHDLAKEFSEGEILSSEFLVTPFTSYAYNAIYTSPNTLNNNPAQRPLPQAPKGKEYHDIVKFAVKQVNEDLQESRETSDFDLVDGITRTDSLKGTEYDLYFRTDEEQHVYHRIKAVRRFKPLQLVGTMETIDTSHDLINLILPLSGRIEKFKQFMKNFIAVGIHWDRRVHLTVVYFGEDGKKEIQNTLTNISKTENFTHYQMIFSNKPFSRGLGLQKGAMDWDKGDVLMFFCDVDIYFTPDFLERCRFYTVPGQQVYYPVVFSMYNPMLVYGGNAPPLNEQLRINHETGFWREYGFGMVCHYRSDFIKTGGFDLSIKGWGKEDIKLYRKYLNSRIKVVRSVDRGLFHLYHSKHCSRDLTDQQYIACLNSKIKSEASHTQLGLIAFGKHIFDTHNPNWIEKLQMSADKHFTKSPNSATTSKNITERTHIQRNSTI